MKQSDKVKSTFKRRLSKVSEHHNDLVLAVRKNVNQAALETMLVEQFVMLSAVQWESFLHDLMVAYVMMRPQVALGSLERRINQSIEGKFGEHAALFTTFKVQKPFTRQKIVRLLDPKDWNITVASAQELTTKANDLLAAEFAKNFSLNKNDAQFIDFAVALRNFLGHRSEASRVALKSSINALTEPTNAVFKGQFRNVGAYLKAKDASGTTRAIAFAARLMSISSLL